MTAIKLEKKGFAEINEGRGWYTSCIFKGYIPKIECSTRKLLPKLSSLRKWQHGTFSPKRSKLRGKNRRLRSGSEPVNDGVGTCRRGFFEMRLKVRGFGS